jgi:LuxR family transcriptional regulator, maltose regulon positive regulatory protein
MLEAIARDALGDLAASDRAVERALDCTKHAALITEILNPLSREPVKHGGPRGMAFALAREDQVRPSPRLAEPLSQSEVRVLRYLPANLSAREVARELSM